MRRYYTVLCEDLQSWVFIYRALLACGVERRDIRHRPYPDNRFNAAGSRGSRQVDGYQVYSCGSQHVRENFRDELALLRRQQRMGRDVALVVHIDVDNDTAAGRTVQDRFRELDLACAPEPPVSTNNDRVCRLVPRRAMETWIAFLDGARVDEHSLYAHLTNREADAAPAAEKFAAHTKDNTAPAQAPPSMLVGFEELRRALA